MDEIEFYQSMVKQVPKFKFLSERGYELGVSHKTESNDALRVGMEYQFRNHNNREVEVSWMYRIDERKNVFCFIVKNKITGNFFSFYDWFANYSPEYSPGLFHLEYRDMNNYLEQVEELDEFLGKYIKNSELDPILRGDRWEDIPFDYRSIGK